MDTKTAKRINSKRNYKNVEYITDKHGSRTRVVIPIDTYDEILEDLHDLAVVAERKDDKSVKFEKVIRDLKRDGLL